MFHMLVILLAAFVAGASLMLVAQSPMERRMPMGADPSLSRVARLYYDGVNTLLASGDSNSLISQIESEFASYSHQSGSMFESRADFIADLQSIRSIRPRLRVTIEELSTSSDLVFASIRLANASDGQFVGLAVESPAAQSFDEVLRIVDGRVVERWAPDWFPMRVLDVLYQRIPAPDEPKIVPELRRWEIAPGGFGDSAGATWRFLLVDSGSIGWSFPDEAGDLAVLSSSDGRWKPHPPGSRLEPGNFVVIPAGVPFHFWNPNATPAQMLVLDLAHPGETTASASRSEGITRTLLARGVVLRPAHGILTIGVGQFWLPVRGVWPHTGIESGGEMVFVTGGALHTTTEDGLYWTVDPQSAVVSSHAPVVPSGQALTIEGPADIWYSASEGMPVSGWIMTFATGASRPESKSPPTPGRDR